MNYAQLEKPSDFKDGDIVISQRFDALVALMGGG